ncbi:MAG: Malate dehydrogenase (oxaloacetate decarboxylating) [Gammaproteobacteria bacterium]|jgi:malate dehydrogenase (oxaloacetate-decarboxylating)|nr:Malate dehydrogenase (oxaloacetate decarboxylating) [Gammaproteobacteria bacterium]
MSFNASNSFIVRLKLKHDTALLSEVMAVIANCGASLGAMDIIRFEDGKSVRDLTLYAQDATHMETIVAALNATPEVHVVHYSDRTFLMHLGGKIGIKSKVPIKTRDDLSMAYTPGVARVCMAIHADPKSAYNLTIKRNMVAVITDGTAVLGLGDIGPLGALPVMEGKAMLFKDFANVDAFPICLDTKDVEEIIATVKRIAPVFGGINLEDISSPRCFEIETRLKKELDIPVFHDDQHGTAIVFTAGLINALKIVKKPIADLKVVVSGVGAAGVACTKMLLNLGVKNIIGCDRKGAISKSRRDLDAVKQNFLEMTNPHDESGSISEVLRGADVFVGLSAPNLLSVDDVRAMAKDPIVFAMANPTPEIMPEVARDYVAIMATGRSDYPNQINNVLAFPGIFRGALDVRAHDINEEMKLAAAHAIADVIEPENLNADYIIPSVFDTRVVTAVAEAVKKAAIETGVAEKQAN